MSDKWEGIKLDEQRRFLDAYLTQPNPRRAALEAGISPSEVEQWLSWCPRFIEWCDLIDIERSPKDEWPDLSETQLAFLAAYRCGPTITQACRIAGINRRNYYNWMQSSKAFVEAFNQTRQERVDDAIDEAHRRAVKGVLEPVFGSDGDLGKTVVVGYKRKFSDRLLVKILESERPEKYRTNHRGPSGSVKHQKTITIADPAIRKQLEQEAEHVKEDEP